MQSPLSTRRLARWSARHPWRVIAAWVVGVVVLMGVASSVGSVFISDMAFTNDEESQVAKRLLADLRGPEPLDEQVIVQSATLTTSDAGFQALVQRITADLRAVPDVQSTVNAFEIADANVAQQLISADRHTTLLPTRLMGDVNTAADHVPALLEVLERYDGRDGFTVVTAGYGSINDAFEKTAEHDLATEFKVMPIALLVLVLVFGAVVAALLPMLLAALTIVVATGLAILVSNIWPLSIFVSNIILTMGLALGIDYALFIVERFREERRHGRERMDAIAVAGDTASRAVLFSGATVVIALSGMLIVPTNLFRALGAGAIFAAVAAVLVSLTLLPALLGLLGDHVNRLSVPYFSRRGGAEEGRGFWAGLARVVMGHPWIAFLGASALLVAMALPYTGVSIGSSGVSAFPPHTDVYRAFAILEQQFSAGRSAPTEIVVRAPDVTVPAVQQAVQRLHAAIGAAGSEITLAPGPHDGPSADRRLDVTTVALRGDFASAEARLALERLREEIVPQALAGAGAEGFVGGQTALNADFFAVVKRYTPVVFAFVLSLSFLLLLMVFRSLVVPLKAIVMNLLSVGASYGVLVLMFQRGWGKVLGFQQVPAIEAWVPLFMFMILFGLSMDYHVFLISRIRERYDQTRENGAAVAHGLRSTANIITGAALIMIVVFGGFAAGDLVMFQQFGFGLAFAVLLDASVVRMVLVPAAMELLGDRNWYLPRWLHRLPDLRVEGDATTAAAGD